MSEVGEFLRALREATEELRGLGSVSRENKQDEERDRSSRSGSAVGGESAGRVPTAESRGA